MSTPARTKDEQEQILDRVLSTLPTETEQKRILKSDCRQKLGDMQDKARCGGKSMAAMNINSLKARNA